MAAFASISLSGVSAAQSATPPAEESKEGLYVVLRTRKLKPETDIDALSATLREGLVPMIEALPGFVEYYIVQNAETGDRTSVSIFRDKTGADRSTTLAGDFLRENNLADLYVDVNPVIVEGSIIVYADQ